MTLLQIIIVAIIPFAMVIYGRWTRKRTAPMKNLKVSFMTRRTVRSVEAWNYAHTLFSNLMFVIGINVLVCSEAFYLAVRVFKHQTYWICVGALVAAQLLGVLMGYLFCCWMVRRAFDKNGEERDPYAEERDDEPEAYTINSNNDDSAAGETSPETAGTDADEEGSR